MTIFTLLQGLSIAIFGGWIVSVVLSGVLSGVARRLRVDEGWMLSEADVAAASKPSLVIDCVERFCLVLLVGLNLAGVGSFLGLWLALRAAMSYPFGRADRGRQRLATHQAVLGLASVTVATLGGAVAGAWVTWDGVSIVASLMPLAALIVWFLAATVTEAAAAAAENMLRTE